MSRNHWTPCLHSVEEQICIFGGTHMTSVDAPFSQQKRPSCPCSEWLQTQSGIFQYALNLWTTVYKWTNDGHCELENIMALLEHYTSFGFHIGPGDNSQGKLLDDCRLWRSRTQIFGAVVAHILNPNYYHYPSLALILSLTKTKNITHNRCYQNDADRNDGFHC